MIEFRPRTLRDRFWRLVSPTRRRRQDAALEEAIRKLVEDPSLPCMVEGRVIPDGYGGPFFGRWEKVIPPVCKECGLLQVEVFDVGCLGTGNCRWPLADMEADNPRPHP
jgi:hypothetical protein